MYGIDLSEAAKRGFSELLFDSFDEALAGAEGSTDWHIEKVRATEHIIEATNGCILTISSFCYIAHIVIYFSRTPALIQYVSEKLKHRLECADDHEFFDYIGELGNICCGNLKGHLIASYPHLGMSIPNILQRESLDYLDTLGYSYSTHLKAERFTSDHSDTAKLYCSLFVNSMDQLEIVVRGKDYDVENGDLMIF